VKLLTKVFAIVIVACFLLTAIAPASADSITPTGPTVWLPFISNSDPCQSTESGCISEPTLDPPCIFATSFITTSTGFGLDTDYAFNGAKICKVIVNDGTEHVFLPYTDGDETYAVFWDAVFLWNGIDTVIAPGNGIAILASQTVTVYLEFYITPK
jgi:hypothetical protein